MLKFIETIEAFNRLLGRSAAWCAIGMMLCQVFSVVARYVFSYGIISVQEAVVYGHAFLFLLGAGFLLQTNEHVRVDIFYNMLSPRTRRWIDVVALSCFVLPVALVILWVGLPYAARSWATLEGSRQAGGIPGIFILKSAIVVFAVTVALQAVATLLRLLCRLPDAHWRSGTEARTH
ncbi:MAG: TRAP transporter small permease subunit [Pseudomonadota bacterium]